MDGKSHHISKSRASTLLVVEKESMLREDKVSVEPLVPLDTHSKKIDIRRGAEEQAPRNDWKKLSSEKSIDTDRATTCPLNDLSEEEVDVLKTAVCLGSFNKTLLLSCAALSDEALTRVLAAAAEKEINRCENGVYTFSSENMKQKMYETIPLEERQLLHLALGRNLVENLSQDELDEHFYTVLLQFHCGLEAITSQSERSAIAVLCLRATHVAVAASDFQAACNYSEFGILLLPPNHWKDEYDLSLALFNDSAEVFHLSANYQRVDESVTAVMENARCFRDTLRVRAARVNSLSSTNRLSEALQEGLDILRHLGVKLPSKPRMYHVTIEFLRTKRLLRGKTSEAILRMPLMDNADKIAAMQMLNLLFPVAYHIDRIQFMLINLRLVRLTMHYGLSAISTVGFAALSAMLVALNKDKEEGFRYSQLALDLLEKFEIREYICRTYFFVYAECLTFKYEIRQIWPFLQTACEVGLQSGDVQVSFHCASLPSWNRSIFAHLSSFSMRYTIRLCSNSATSSFQVTHRCSASKRT